MPIPPLVTAEELSRDLAQRHKISLSVERILDLARGGYLPHTYCEGNPPLFRLREAKEWIARNLLMGREGKRFPTQLTVLDVATYTGRYPAVPPGLAILQPHLQELPRDFFRMGHCVYFLLKGDTIIYIGETINLPKRLDEHTRDKDFDRILFMQVPTEEALAVEKTFIDHFKPVLNTAKLNPVNHHDYPAVMRRYCGDHQAETN